MRASVAHSASRAEFLIKTGKLFIPFLRRVQQLRAEFSFTDRFTKFVWSHLHTHTHTCIFKTCSTCSLIRSIRVRSPVNAHSHTSTHLCYSLSFSLHNSHTHTHTDTITGYKCVTYTVFTVRIQGSLCWVGLNDLGEIYWVNWKRLQGWRVAFLQGFI